MSQKTLIELAQEYAQEKGLDPSSVSMPEPNAKPKNVLDQSIEDALAILLKNVPQGESWLEVELPSRGKSYKDGTDRVQLTPFKYEQERKLRTASTNAGVSKVIKSLFGDCMRGIDYDSLTLADKNYILFMLRKISYGDKYEFEVDCPSCHQGNKLNVNISDFIVKYADDDFVEPIKVTLPDSKIEVSFVSPRCSHEQLFETTESAIDNIPKLILSVGPYKEQRVIRAFLQKTTLRDFAFLRDKVFHNWYGLVTRFKFDCLACQKLQDIELPITAGFFTAS